MPTKQKSKLNQRPVLQVPLAEPRKFFETKEFNKLQSKWTKKLKDSGFEDIENGDSPQSLKQSSFRQWVVDADPILYEAKAQYYRLATLFYNSYKFDSKFHKDAWLLHSEGKSFETIVKELKKPMSQVRNLIPKLTTEMFVQYKVGKYAKT